MTTHPQGGRGSNQYRTIGTPTVPPAATSSAVLHAVTDSTSDSDPVESVPLSAVPLQGGYRAKSCATKTQHDLDPTMVGQEEPDTPAQMLLQGRGNRFESGLFARMAGQRGVLRIPDGDRLLQQSLTEAAMRAGTPIILGGWLPDDEKHRRTGKPDVLVKIEDPNTGTFGYMPVDVKWHTLTAPSDKPGDTVDAADLTDPTQPVAVPNEKFVRSYLESDGMQLAHYQRMLEDMGMAAPGPVTGAIIDKSGRVIRVPLDEPTWQVVGHGKETTMARYDREFDRHLRIARQQLARNDDPTVPRPAPPVRCGDCPTCKWRTACRNEMTETDHVSLLHGMTTTKAETLAAAGVTTRRHVAEMDPVTARAAATTPKTDFGVLFADARRVPPTTPIEHLLGRKTKQIANLHDNGVHTAGDVLQLDELTAVHASGSGFTKTIDQARAAVSGQIWRARGAPPDGPRRATVELHLDMENNVDGRVYLWGSNTADRDTGTARYDPVVSWDPDLDEQGEAELVARAWQHLQTVSAAAAADGKDVRIMVHSHAEATQLRRIAAWNDEAGRPVPGCPTVEDVDTVIGSDRWIDCRHETEASVVTGFGYGLKDLAPHAGFTWSDPYASGDESMVMYEAAVHVPDPAVRATMQRRILTYNQEDTQATKAVLDWLTVSAPSMPPIETWVP